MRVRRGSATVSEAGRFVTTWPMSDPSDAPAREGEATRCVSARSSLRARRPTQGVVGCLSAENRKHALASISVVCLDSRRTPVVVDCLPLWEIDMPDAVIHSNRSFHPARRRRRLRFAAAILALVACLGARTAFADAVALTGRVTDGHGGVVAGADVRVRRDDGTRQPSHRERRDRHVHHRRAAGRRLRRRDRQGRLPAPTSPSSALGLRHRDARCRARRRRRAGVGRRHRFGAAAVDARDVEGGQRDRRRGDHARATP